MGRREEEEESGEPRDRIVVPGSGPHVAGLILARGGSEGIPLKNLAPLGPERRPLLSWALEAMLEVAVDQPGGFDSVWVSTEHSAIAACAKRHQGVQVFWRSALYARSSSPSVDAVAEFLSARPEVDVVCLVQCTSPLVRPEFLRRALDTMREGGGRDSVFGVTR